MTLRLRLILTMLVVLAASSLVTWFGVRPAYEQALLDERLTLITEYQQQRIAAAETRLRSWLRIGQELQEVLLRDPMRLETVSHAYIRLFTDLQSVRITEVRTGEYIQVQVPGTEPLPSYAAIADSLFDFQTEEAVRGRWEPDGSRMILVWEFVLDGRHPFRLMLSFHTLALEADLLRNVLGTGSFTAVWTGPDTVVPDSIPLTFRPDFDGMTTIRTADVDGRERVYVASPIAMLPFRHVVYADADLISAPVRRLFTVTLWLLAAVFVVLSAGAVAATEWVRRPLDRFLEDVSPFADVSFDRPFRESRLPELKALTQRMELIRLRLRHYQRINVEQIIVQEQRNQLFMAHSSILVAHFGETGTWLYRNEAMMGLMDQMGVDVEGLEEFLRSPLVTLSDKSEQRLIRGDIRTENHRFDVGVTVADGSTFTLRGHRMETFAADGRHMGGFLLLNDVTQERELDHMRTEMIHIIVHELQNPIAAVRGFLEILQDEDMTEEEVREIYALCFRSVETLRELIDRFLAITRLESGKTEIEWEPVLLTQLVRNVSDGFLPQLREKRLSLVLDLKPVPIILGSNTLLEDVVRNLVSNAIKYGDPDRTIEVDLTAGAESVILRVTDHGFGIPEEHRDKLFQKFYRIKAYKKQKGNGLGLAYVREIVIKHNGAITFESDADIGTRFIVRLPYNMHIG